MNVKELFSEWTDFDIAEYYLACLFGFCKFDQTFEVFRETKAIYNTKNRVETMLYDILQNLIDGGVLDFDESLSQVRANQAFAFNKSESLISSLLPLT